MEIVVIFITMLFLFIGLAGCILPVIPGPIISLIGLFFFHFFTSYKIGFNMLFLFVVLVIFITILDYWLQLYGVQRFGGGKKAIYGTFFGLLIGIFLFPPFGILFGPLTGAFFGSLMEKKNTSETIKITLGAFLGFIVGAVFKLLISSYIIYLVIVSLI
jgi:hypothetical protein